ncbi:hypothetical protein GPY23_02860 [Photorhabdus bodei]|nr:hypothetical protein [Photorhabdus bodei]
MTGVSECSQQRGNLKDNGYNSLFCLPHSFITMGFCLNCYFILIFVVERQSAYTTGTDKSAK